MDTHIGSDDPTVTAALGASTVRTVLTLLLVLGLLVVLPPPARAQGRWIWPIAPPHPVHAPFDEPNGPYGAGHRGIDILAETPTVTAVEAGTVRFTGMVAGRPVVSILHADGLLSTYEPVVASVPVGTAVAAGTPIGQVVPEAASHCAPATCLHLGARRGRTYLDPLLLLGERGPSVLLPLTGGGAHADGAVPSAAGPVSAPTGAGTSVEGVGASAGYGAGLIARGALAAASNAPQSGP